MFFSQREENLNRVLVTSKQSKTCENSVSMIAHQENVPTLYSIIFIFSSLTLLFIVFDDHEFIEHFYFFLGHMVQTTIHTKNRTMSSINTNEHYLSASFLLLYP